LSRVIVIEGLIGVGKTSLCRILEEEMGASLVLEPCDDNPFLTAFYEERDRYAFPAQMFYLATRYSQQMNLRQPGLFNRLVVSDYLFEKDRIFAEQTLEGDEMALYDRFAGLLSGTIPRPDFVLFLDSPTDVVLSRIAHRDRTNEGLIEPAYLDELRERYMALWNRYKEAPIYILDTSTIDYVGDEAAKDRMLAMIQGWLDGKPTADAPQAYHPVPEDQLQLFAAI
jgi:deoxyguanosine kinase